MKILTPDADGLMEAAMILRRGGIGIVPTETVYGLACDATSATGVASIYRAKGRPADNPLIHHAANMDMVQQIADCSHPAVKSLAETFWPGPLTLVLPARSTVLPEAIAGGSTVAVRIPAHPMMRHLISLTFKPLAAPSANLSGQLSPTSLEQIDPKLADQVEFALDGGPCTIGIESTIFDLTGEIPTVVRTGHVTPARLRALLGGQIEVRRHDEGGTPGSYAQHYAPRTPLYWTDSLGELPGIGFQKPRHANQIRLPKKPEPYAEGLYRALFTADCWGVERLYVERPPQSQAWMAIRDRLERAVTKASGLE